MDLFNQGRDPSEDSPARTRRGGGDSDASRTWTVTRFNERVRRVLQDGIAGDQLVRGEIGSLRRARHWYFTLKDQASELSCVAWASTATRFDRTLANGDEVVVTGSIDHWTKAGRTSLIVRRIERAGVGALQQAFERLRRELQDAGWFADERKRPLSPMPRRIAVITSASGAAIEDVRRTARDRLPAVGLVLYDVQVQGERAAGMVVDAIGRAASDADRLAIDAILVTRGGGSAEDLAAFNERSVAEAVHRCPVPVVAAIGHESDTTIIELVADRRASTPTQAAMVLVPDGEEERHRIDASRARLDGTMARMISAGRTRLAAVAERPVVRMPAIIVAARRERHEDRGRRLLGAVRRRVDAARVRLAGLEARRIAGRPDALLTARRARVAALGERLAASGRTASASLRASIPDAGRLDTAVERRLDAARSELAGLERGLRLVSPHGVLDRGYAFIEGAADGRLVRGTDDVAVGDRVRAHMSDGVLDLSVEGATRSVEDVAGPREPDARAPGR